MTIKNIGSKIISIGTTVLMPDASLTTDKKTAETPAIKAMVKAGLLSVEEDVKPTRAPRQSKDDDAAAKAAAEEAEKKAAEEAAKKAAEEAAKKAAEEAAKNKTGEAAPQ